MGGWLTTEFSWRWAFGINIPLGAAVFIGTLIFVSESRDSDTVPGVDLFGALLSVLGIGLIVFGLIEGRTFGWWSTLGTPSVGPLTWTLPISPIVLAFVLGVLADKDAAQLTRIAAQRMGLQIFVTPPGPLPPPLRRPKYSPAFWICPAMTA